MGQSQLSATRDAAMAAIAELHRRASHVPRLGPRRFDAAEVDLIRDMVRRGRGVYEIGRAIGRDTGTTAHKLRKLGLRAVNKAHTPYSAAELDLLRAMAAAGS
jgi:hypothetical protein